MTTPNFQGQIGSGVPSDTLNIINGQFEKIFSLAFMSATPQASFIQKRTATGKYVNLAATMQTPIPGLWKGNKQAQSVQVALSPMTMFPLQSSIQIDQWDFMGDVVGTFGDAVTSIGKKAALYDDFAWSVMVQSALQSDYNSFWSGNALNDYGLQGNMTDTLPLFSPSHVFSDNSQVAAQTNMVTGSLSDPLTWGNAVTTMMSYVGDQGQPLRIRPVGAVHAPQDTYSIYNALKSTLTAIDQRPTITTTNAMPKVALSNVINTFGLQLFPLDFLYNNPGVSYLIGEVEGVVSSYSHWLDPLHLVPSIDPTSNSVFYEHQYIWSVQGFGRVILPNWFTIIRVVDPTIAKNVT